MLQNQMFTLISLLILALSVQTKYIQVPAVVNDDTLSLRLNQMHRVSSVFHQFGQLQRIFKKEVYEIVDGNEVAFPTCYEEMPFATLEARGSIYIGSSNSTNGLVYDFDKIKNRRNLIDIELTERNIFYAREDGFIRTVRIQKGSLRLSLAKQFRTNETKLSKGNLVILPNATYGKSTGCGIFINHNQAVLFDLEGDNFTQLEGFLKMKDFEAAVPIEDKYLAAAYGEEGVVIYSVDFNAKKLKVEAQFDKNNLDLKTLNIKDLAYDNSRKLVFMLDHNSGVLPLQLIINSNTLKAQLTSSVIKNSYCNLIYYDSFTEELYMNCRELIKYHINNWPVLDQKVLPRQEISIRSISSSGGSVVLAGRNVLQVIAQERKVAVYEDKLLEKFILKDNIFLSANEHYLLIGTYQIFPPEISCQSSTLSMAGNHKLLFKITAECNIQYFSSIGFNPGQILQDDKCIYSVYQTAKFWEPKEVNVNVFVYMLAAIFVLGLALLIWWGISQLKLKKLRNYVEHYQTLEQEQVEKAPKKDAMAAELSPAISAEESNKKNENKVESIEMGEELHDIE